MRELASIEVMAAVHELKQLEGTYLKKFYEVEKGSFKFSFAGKENSGIVYVGFFRTIYITTFSEEVGAPTNFATAVRKRIKGAKLASIKQHEPDRIVIFSFEGKEGNFRLVAELFGKGNLLLLDESSEIKLSYHSITQKERSLRPHAQYEFPKSNSLGFNAAKPEISEAVQNALSKEMKLIKALLQQIDIGPIYMENLLVSMGLDPNQKASSAASSQQAIADAISSFLSSSATTSPTIYMKDDEFVDYAIFPISKYSGLQQKTFNSVSELLDAFYMGERSKIIRKEDKVSKHVKELEASIEKQKELIVQLGKDSVDQRNAANVIMRDMHRFNELIQYVRASKKPDADDIMNRFGIKVKKINLKDKTITIEV